MAALVPEVEGGTWGRSSSGVTAAVCSSRPDRIRRCSPASGPSRSRYRAPSREDRPARSGGRHDRRPIKATIQVEIGVDVEASWLVPGQAAEVAPDPPDGSAPVPGKVVSIGSTADGPTSLVVEVSDPPASIRSARFASIAIRPLVAGREPFRSMPRGEPPIRSGEARSFHTCPDHPELIRFESGRCPKDEKPLERLDLAKNQRVAWWCPMHPKVVADRAGSECSECGGMALVPRVVSYCPIGEILAVPESAVIDTGSRQVVYVERMPGMFDGVEVRLGPRSGEFYPVVEGLEAGQAVAISGAFLVDAETRLNPSLAAGYFGARRPVVAASKPEARPDKSNLDALKQPDRDLAIAQATCPVTGKALGSMGTPVRVVARGRTVFLCCQGCVGAIKDDPDKYLARLKPPSTAHHP